MARRVNQALREEWRKRIEGQQQSGLTVAEFCQREGVSTATFYVWRRKLQTKRSPPTKKAPPRQKQEARTHRQGAPSAAQSHVPFVQLPLSVPAASPWIEVVLAEGTVVRLPQQNLAALQTVLRTLGGAAAASATGDVKYA
jgi:transposase-like protein